MPWTIYRHILWELLRLIVVAATVLVVVMSFAATIKPLTNGLLGPVSLVKFVLYSAPTMLGFVLPFAGAFASTLVFIRLSSDNEIVACSASGMSYFQILVPVIALGAVLTMSLFLLLNFVIPSYWQAATQTLEKDLMSLLVKRLNANQPFDEIGDTIIYADRAFERDSPEVPEGHPVPHRYIGLEGVVIGEPDAQGRIWRVATSKEAHIALYRMGDESYLQVDLAQFLGYDPDAELSQNRINNLQAVRLPSSVRERAKYLSLPELHQLWRQPQRFEKIRKQMGQLVNAIAAESLQLQLLSATAAGPVQFKGPAGYKRSVLRSPTVRSNVGQLILEGTDNRLVELEVFADTGSVRRFEAATAVVDFVPGDQTGQVTISIELPQVTVYDTGPAKNTTSLTTKPLPNLIWPGLLIPVDLPDTTMQHLVEYSQGIDYAMSDRVIAAKKNLQENWLKVQRRIKGRLHERAATSIACFLLLLLGAVLSLMNRDQLPLVVYFWSFLLAIVTIILVNSGFAVARDIDRPLWLGLGLLWSGNINLAVLAGVFYCRLARN